MRSRRTTGSEPKGTTTQSLRPFDRISASDSGLPNRSNEAERLAAVRRYDILDTPRDGAFDRITSFAAKIFDAPLAMVTIVDERRIWFKSLSGNFNTSEIPREPGLCATAVYQDTPYVVEGAKTDPRTRDNSLVTGSLGIQFYAAAPLRTRDGYNLGTLCILDDRPRRLAPSDIDVLETLAAIVVDELDLGLEARRRITSERELRKDVLKLAGESTQLQRKYFDAISVFTNALLPRAFPKSARLRFHGVYVPATDGFVGGDWYDAFAVDERRIFISVGDVGGHGLDSAIVMGNVKQSMRTVASEYASPEKLLNRIDSMLCDNDVGKIVGAFAAYLNTDNCALTYANAGHPPPIVRRPDGTVTMLETGGAPLGYLSSNHRVHRTLRMEPGCLLILYTDGLTEATRNVLEGERRVCEAIQSNDVLSADNPAEALRRAVIPNGSHDDVAILTVSLM